MAPGFFSFIGHFSTCKQTFDFKRSCPPYHRCASRSRRTYLLLPFSKSKSMLSCSAYSLANFSLRNGMAQPFTALERSESWRPGFCQHLNSQDVYMEIDSSAHSEPLANAVNNATCHLQVMHHEESHLDAKRPHCQPRSCPEAVEHMSQPVSQSAALRVLRPKTVNRRLCLPS